MNIDGRLKQPTEPSSYMKEVIHPNFTSENIPVSILSKHEYIELILVCCCWNLSFFVCEQANVSRITTQQIWFGFSENSGFELR